MGTETLQKQLTISPSYTLNTLEFMYSTYKSFLEQPTSKPIFHNKTFYTKEVLVTTISSFKPKILVHIIIGDLYQNIFDPDSFQEILLKTAKKINGKIYSVYDKKSQNQADREIPEGYIIKDISEFFIEFHEGEIDFVFVDIRAEMNNFRMKQIEYFKINNYVFNKLSYKCVFMINDCYDMKSDNCELISTLMQTHDWKQLETRCKCLFAKGFS
jgi:hypothetical protein